MEPESKSNAAERSQSREPRSSRLEFQPDKSATCKRGKPAVHGQGRIATKHRHSWLSAIHHRRFARHGGKRHQQPAAHGSLNHRCASLDFAIYEPRQLL